MNTKKSFLSRIAVVTGLSLGAFALAAIAGTWTPPSVTPPNGNVPPPIYQLGTTAQDAVSGLLALKALVFNPNCSNGVCQPVAANSVLVASTSGDGTVAWAPPGSGSGNGTGIQIGTCAAFGPTTRFTSSTLCPLGSVMCGLNRVNDNNWDSTGVFCAPVYLTGTTLTGPATGATCSVTDSYVGQPTSFYAQAQGGTGQYSYVFTIDGVPQTAQTSPIYSKTYSTPGTGHTASVNVKAIPAAVGGPTAGITATCSSSFDTTYMAIDTSRLTCAAGVPTYTNPGLASGKASVKYTISGTPTGGDGVNYYYQFESTNGISDATDSTISSSNPVGINSGLNIIAPLSYLSGTNKYITISYKDANGTLVTGSPLPSPLDVMVTSVSTVDAGFICNPPAFIK